MQPTSDRGLTGPTGRVDPNLPQVFGRYLLVQRLSRGGMGEIFLAKHGLTGFEKLAVIKKVLPHLAADQQFISRFVDEAQVAIKLQHVNVAQVFEVGRVGDEYFLALEYVEGRDLRRTLAVLAQRARRLPVDLALFIGRELANGLAYAHRRTHADGSSLNLVHCDISPPNVLVSFEGETKVIDFGIAKSALRATATDPKMGFGKFGYMAPEQLIRGGVVDHRTDIYAAGVVLFELLAGLRLYEPGPEPDYRSLAKQVAKGEHKFPSEIDKKLAPYDDLVATALRPKQDDRYQSAAEFRDAIQQALVAVNPTISTDQLGAYMRDLFADEMTAQRELHERVARAHLEDFQDQLTTQTGTTVSFALAGGALPLQPTPPKLPAARPTSPPSRPRPPTTPTEIISPPVGASVVGPAPKPPTTAPASAPAVAQLPTHELSLADGTGTMEPEDLSLPPPRRSRAPIAIGAFAAVVVVGAVVFAMTRGGGEPDKPAVAANEPAAPSKVIVEPIAPEPEPVAAAPDAAPAPAPAPQPEVAIDPIPPQPAHPPKSVAGSAKHPPKHPDKRADKPAPSAGKPELTKDQVGAKMRAASHEYEAFKQQNGPRFDNDWNDIMTFSTYHGDQLEELAHKIDAFRQKLRE